jgi:hypothetical protein
LEVRAAKKAPLQKAQGWGARGKKPQVHKPNLSYKLRSIGLGDTEKEGMGYGT